MKKQLLKLLLLLALSVSFIACEEDENMPTIEAEVTGCNTFRFEGENFNIPSGFCSSSATVEFEELRNGETFRFDITCEGGCIGSVVKK